MRKFSATWLGVILFGCVICLTTPLRACSVPVFRYALERWQVYPFEAVVFHRGELTEDQKAVVKMFGKDGLAGKVFANIRVMTVDLDENKEKELHEFWESQKIKTLPWVIVTYPREQQRIPIDRQTKFPVNAWSGPLDAKSVKGLLQSPKRHDIARRILKGDSAVWVFLDSGDKKKDDAAFKLLQQEVTRQQKELKLPEIKEEDIKQGLILIDPMQLKLKFSVLRLSREDAAEKAFIDMLLGTEEGIEPGDTLRDVKQPMVFPFFGRGRALYALVGAGINKQVIEQAGIDLTGPCTCTIKEKNPGTDMLMAVDWDRLVEPFVEVDKELPPLGLGAFAAKSQPNGKDEEPANKRDEEPADDKDQEHANPPADDAVKTGDAAKALDETTSTSIPTSSSATATPAEHATGLKRNILILAALAIVAVFAGSFFLVSKKG